MLVRDLNFVNVEGELRVCGIFIPIERNSWN